VTRPFPTAKYLERCRRESERRARWQPLTPRRQVGLYALMAAGLRGVLLVGGVVAHGLLPWLGTGVTGTTAVLAVMLPVSFAATRRLLRVMEAHHVSDAQQHHVF